MEYSGLNFLEIEEVDIFSFWLLLRDAVIYKLNQSDSGKEYLEECWCRQQTEPDRGLLRRIQEMPRR